jgi:regulator of sigma E protease
MIDESMDTKQMQTPPQPYEYRAKPAWQRFIIISAGVVVNFILALAIYSVTLYTWGEEYLPTKNLTYGITCDPLAEEMGFKNGDKIISVDGAEIESFSQIAPSMVLEAASRVQVERNGRIVDVEIDPKHIPQQLKTATLFQPRYPLEIGFVADESKAEEAGFMIGDRLAAINGQEAKYFDEFRAAILSNISQTLTISMDRKGEMVDLEVVVPENGVIGISSTSPGNFFEFKKIEYSFFEAIPAGISRGANMISSYLKQLKLVFSPKTKAYESVGGFITIGSIFPKVWDWQAFWNLTALISIILAIMNMLPIPALDGGHMLFLVYEMVSGRKPADKFMEYAQIAGMLLILSLVLFANANDVIKLFN